MSVYPFMGVCTHKVYTHTQCRHVCICTYTQTEMLSHLKSLKFIRAMGERNAIAEGKAASRPCLYREVYNAEGEGLGDQRGVGVPVHAATAWQSVRGEDELQPPTDALPSVPVTFRPQGWARQASAVSQQSPGAPPACGVTEILATLLPSLPKEITQPKQNTSSATVYKLMEKLES